MSTNQGVVDWTSEKVDNGVSVVLPAEKRSTNIIYCREGKGHAWRPTSLPYNANWDKLTHDGEKFIVEDSRNARLQAVSVDGKTWRDAGT